MKPKILWIPIVAISILMVPLIAMQFTKEVNWSFSDFVVMGLLFLLVGSGIELVRRKNKEFTKRLVYIFLLVLLFLLLWAELAVGIFGTPFAGS